MDEPVGEDAIEFSGSQQNQLIDAVWKSPVQEEHIDFVLEEEFNCNPNFLDFFCEAAMVNFVPLPGEPNPVMMKPSGERKCQAIRSCLEQKGETDVLVIYRSENPPGRVAILVESKIRAYFQKDQAKRYIDRGEAGKHRSWEFYWTCLVAPAKYAQDNVGFSTRITLEKLSEFFDSPNDQRMRFKKGVIQRALNKFDETGLQLEDPCMTNFRAFYAQQAASFFHGSDIEPPRARPAWWDDQWFSFKSSRLSRGVTIVHKSRAGLVDLSFPNTQKSLLDQVLTQNSDSTRLVAEQTGKSASLRFRVQPISEYGDHTAAIPKLTETFQRARDLLEFYQKNKDLIDHGNQHK